MTDVFGFKVTKMGGKSQRYEESINTTTKTLNLPALKYVRILFIPKGSSLLLSMCGSIAWRLPSQRAC